MTDYNGEERTLIRTQGTQERSVTGASSETATIALTVPAERVPIILDGYYAMPSTASSVIIQTVNRGRNTGEGAAFVFWLSLNGVDLIGTYYTGIVPFGQLTDIVGVGTVTS